MDAHSKEIQALFAQYLDVCNRAMDAHKEEFPYKHIWEAAERLQSDAGMHITVYDDEPKGDYQLKIQDKHIELLDDSDADEAPGWRINTSYLKQVVEHPEEYIAQPTKLDWHWLKNRAGMD